MSRSDHHEKRRSLRERRSDAMFWSRTKGELPEMGWLLERSDDGAAFAWRGGEPPCAGAILYVQLDAASRGDAKRAAVVRRVSRAHDDLFVIAAELVELHGVPPMGAARSIPVRAPVRVFSGASGVTRLAA